MIMMNNSALLMMAAIISASAASATGHSYSEDDPRDYGFGGDDFDPDDEDGYTADTPDYSDPDLE